MAVSKLCILCVVCVLFVALSDSANTNEKAKGHARLDLANPAMGKGGLAAKGDLGHHARLDAAKMKGKKARSDYLKKRGDDEESLEDDYSDSDSDSSSESSSEEEGDDEKKKKRMSARLAHGKSRSGGAPKPKGKPSAKAGKP